MKQIFYTGTGTQQYRSRYAFMNIGMGRQEFSMKVSGPVAESVAPKHKNVFLMISTSVSGAIWELK
jgi:hypothetical protein